MGRTIAIGDIHGCRAALESLLDAVAPSPDDHLVTLGDVINRGPDSRGVIDRLIALESQTRYTPILGNHDQALLDLVDGAIHLPTFLGMGGEATLASYGMTRHRFQGAKLPPAHLEFLRRCQPWVETDHHVFTHAGYIPYLPMLGQPPYILRWSSLRDEIPGPHVSGKRVILGHTSQKSGEPLVYDHVVCIDTYCYGGGWLTALDVETGQTWQVDREGRPRVLEPHP
jgi:serine/threonine protein phosphatase 1